jgi:hypothetical protein
MAQFVKNTQPILLTIIVGILIVGIVLAVLGAALVYRGAIGETEFNFFGQHFKSTNIGIAAIFVAAAMIVLVLRRILKTVDNTVKYEAPLEAGRALAFDGPAANLAKAQLDQLEADKKFPKVSTNIYPVKIHYSDGVLEDMVVEITFENASSLNRSLNDCSVGFLKRDSDRFPAHARQAQNQFEQATYPIQIAPHSSLILYSYMRHLRKVFEKEFGPEEVKTVVVYSQFAGADGKIVQRAATFSAAGGLRPL